jgi:hypothetical protein
MGSYIDQEELEEITKKAIKSPRAIFMGAIISLFLIKIILGIIHPDFH